MATMDCFLKFEYSHDVNILPCWLTHLKPKAMKNEYVHKIPSDAVICWI